MANGNIYTWDFYKLDVYSQQGGQSNVVTNVNWKFTGQDPTLSYRAVTTGGSKLSPYVSGSFVPYNQLTPAIIESWVKAALPANQYGAMTQSIDNSLRHMAENASTQGLPPPWQT